MYVHWVLSILFVPLMAWLDRQRGSPPEIEVISKVPALFGMGYICAFYTGHVFDVQTLIIMLAVWAGHGIGYGAPLGYALTGVTGMPADDGSVYEPWQVTDLLKRNPWVALALRGVMVGAVALLSADIIAAGKIAVAFGIAFPLASYIVRYHITTSSPDDAWGKQEYVRGGLTGFILLVFSLV